MSLQIRRCESRTEWDAFLEDHPTPTFLQSWEWGTFNEQQNHKIDRYLIEEGNGTVAVALVIEIRARRGSYFLCAHGPIIAPEANTKDVIDTLTRKLIEEGKKRSIDFIRLCPLLLDGSENRSLIHALGYRPAPIHQTPELAWMLRLDKTEEELLKDMRKTTRYTINRAEKDGVEVVMSDRLEDLPLFWNVYAATVDRQHFTAFSQTYLKQEFETFHAKDQVRFFFGKYQGEIISAAMVLFLPHSGFYHQGASVHLFPKINASCNVQWAAIQEAKRRGCAWYNFWGIAPPDQPKHPWTGLSLFKTGFGGQSEAYLHAQDKPLSMKYWLNYLIETIRARKRGFQYK